MNHNITRKGYYDIEVDISDLLSSGGMVDEMFYLNDLKARKLFLNTDINADSVFSIVKHIMQYNREDADAGLEVKDRTPIKIYITSPGGEVDAGFSLIDAIEASITPVQTINMGFEYSMAFLIGLAGHERFTLPNAKFLMHDGSAMFYSSGSKVRDEVDFHNRVEERVKSYILRKSNISSELYDSKLRIEWYMFADEAKEMGFVDRIIGTDCNINDII